MEAAGFTLTLPEEEVSGQGPRKPVSEAGAARGDCCWPGVCVQVLRQHLSVLGTWLWALVPAPPTISPCRGCQCCLLQDSSRPPGCGRVWGRGQAQKMGRTGT